MHTTPSSPISAASILSTSPSCSSLSSSSTRSTCSDAASIASSSSSSVPHRPNEHLAVLLPRHLWKPDSGATHCDNFYCRVPFSVFERRHHCRKCGGVFCGPCSQRSTSLLDTSALGFLHPPRGTPLSAYESPESPIRSARVCDDCFDQIHAVRSPVPASPVRPRRPASLLASPIALFKSPAPSPAPSAPSSPPTSDSPLSPSLPPSLTRASPSPRPRRAPLVRTASLPYPGSQSQSPAPERSYGELDAYPLRRASLLCKATGGGRWEPKPQQLDPAARLPIIGGRAPYELEMEREEEEERRRRRNPVVRDGDFQYRFPSTCEPEPAVLERVPIVLATF